jgi:hypothetical protein
MRFDPHSGCLADSRVYFIALGGLKYRWSS